jgi:hypothetical protein
VNEVPEHHGPVIDDQTRAPSAAALPPNGRYITMGADVRIIRDHVKVATGGSSSEKGGNAGEQAAFTIYSDEPPFLGGEGSHPQPLLYIAAGIGF